MFDCTPKSCPSATDGSVLCYARCCGARVSVRKHITELVYV